MGVCFSKSAPGSRILIRGFIFCAVVIGVTTNSNPLLAAFIKEEAKAQCVIGLEDGSVTKIAEEENETVLQGRIGWNYLGGEDHKIECVGIFAGGDDHVSWVWRSSFNFNRNNNGDNGSHGAVVSLQKIERISDHRTPLGDKVAMGLLVFGSVFALILGWFVARDN